MAAPLLHDVSRYLSNVPVSTQNFGKLFTCILEIFMGSCFEVMSFTFLLSAIFIRLQPELLSLTKASKRGFTYYCLESI